MFFTWPVLGCGWGCGGRRAQVRLIPAFLFDFFIKFNGVVLLIFIFFQQPV
jgi:hypothetical protein